MLRLPTQSRSADLKYWYKDKFSKNDSGVYLLNNTRYTGAYRYCMKLDGLIVYQLCTMVLFGAHIIVHSF